VSELESVQRDRDGRVVAVTVEGRTLRYVPKDAATEADRRVAAVMVAADEMLREWFDYDLEPDNRTHLANRIAGIAEDVYGAAVGGPGPTPEPACEHGQQRPHEYTMGGRLPKLHCPGPTDDERPATGGGQR